MYLVLVKTVKVVNEFGMDLLDSPIIEKLQAFEYQLKSDRWSVIDCVREKGGSFELHVGLDSEEEFHSNEDAVVMHSCAVICHDALSALKVADYSLKSVMDRTIDHAAFYQKLPSGSVFIWFRGDARASKFNLKP